MTSLHRATGFTITEMTIVLAITAVLAGIGAPSFRTLLQNQRLTATTNDFFAALALTRSEAIKRGSRVDLVPADGKQWENGWVIYVDNNDNQIFDDGDQVIFTHGAVPQGLTIKSALTDSSRPYIAYNGAGRTRTDASSQLPQLGTISFSLDKKVRRIKLNFAGRARSCNPESDTGCD